MSLIFAVISLLGLLWGSFLNVIIYRLPQTAAAGIYNSRRSLMFLSWPWSFCPKCRTRIDAWNNIPIISYLLLRGRGSCCKERISSCYPLIEASGALIVFASLSRFGLNIDALFAFLFLSFLLVASVIDLRRYYLLDILTIPLLWLGLLVNLDARFVLINDAVLGAIAGYTSLTLLAAVSSAIMGRRALGGGDPKLFAALGSWLGWQALPFVLFLASVFALLFGVAKSLLRGRRSRQVPFGPCLSMAAAIILFYGEDIYLSYLSYLSQ